MGNPKSKMIYDRVETTRHEVTEYFDSDVGMKRGHGRAGFSRCQAAARLAPSDVRRAGGGAVLRGRDEVRMQGRSQAGSSACRVPSAVEPAGHSVHATGC